MSQRGAWLFIYSFVPVIHPSVPVFSFHILSFEVGHTGNEKKVNAFLSLSLSSDASSFISIPVIDRVADIDWMERKGLLQREREAVLESSG